MSGVQPLGKVIAHVDLDAFYAQVEVGIHSSGEIFGPDVCSFLTSPSPTSPPPGSP